MKTVFSTLELCHEFFYRDNLIGKCNANMFCRDNVIYSYGSHFPIAAKYNVSGRPVVLFTSRDYSNTTAKHKSKVWRAIPLNEYMVFTVPFVCDFGRGNLDYLIKQVDDNVQQAKRAVKYGCQCLESAENYRLQVIEYAALIGATVPDTLNESILTTYAALYETGLAKRAAADQRAAELAAERRRVMELDNAAKIELWRSGSNVQLPYGLNIMLRVKGSHIETSRGVRVSLNTCRVFWSRVKSNESVIGFKFDEMYTTVAFNGILKVGCHTIERGEVDRLVAALGW